jgi:alkylhydroperoxidase family enzyme
MGRGSNARVRRPRSDAAYDDARAQFNEKELADLTLAIAAINAWNRLSIAARLAPGTYQSAPAEPVQLALRE